VSKRRGAGEGAVYRRADGLWVGAVDLGRDPTTGRRRRKVVKAKTKAETLRKLADVRQRLGHGGPVTDDRRSTGEYLAWWCDDVLAGTVKPSTEASYRWLIETYVMPRVGMVPLAKLAPSHVQSMLKALEKEGLSPRTRQYARAVLRRALGHAERWDLVRRNAAALTDSPKGAGTKLDDALTADEARRVLVTAEGERLEALAVLALSLGMRRGELLGLRWSDVDLVAQELTVARTLTRVPGQGIVVTSPKTEAGKRTMPLIGRCGPVLVRHRRLQQAEREAADGAWQESGHVFTTPLGTVLDPGNALHWWYALTERTGVGRRRFHATRHTAATLLLDEGVKLEVVSAVLGHVSLAITADVYARPTMDAKRRSLEQLARTLGTPSKARR
jgi:integrase